MFKILKIENIVLQTASAQKIFRWKNPSLNKLGNRTVLQTLAWLQSNVLRNETLSPLVWWKVVEMDSKEFIRSFTKEIPSTFNFKAHKHYVRKASRTQSGRAVSHKEKLQQVEDGWESSEKYETLILLHPLTWAWSRIHFENIIQINELEYPTNRITRRCLSERQTELWGNESVWHCTFLFPSRSSIINKLDEMDEPCWKRIDIISKAGKKVSFFHLLIMFHVSRPPLSFLFLTRWSIIVSRVCPKIH